MLTTALHRMWTCRMACNAHHGATPHVDVSDGMQCSPRYHHGALPPHTGTLGRAMGAAAHADVSGGTPALQLNETHMLAVGHTMTWSCNRDDVRRKGPAARARCKRRHRWRSYAMFAYTFSTAPPFSLYATSREFRLRLPDATSVVPTLEHEAVHHERRAASSGSDSSYSHRVGGGLPPAHPGVSSPDLLPDLLPDGVLLPPAPVRAVHEKLRGVEGKIQFQIGLMWTMPENPDTSRDRRRCVTLSWGHDDRESFVSVVPLDALLGAGLRWVALS